MTTKAEYRHIIKEYEVREDRTNQELHYLRMRYCEIQDENERLLKDNQILRDKIEYLLKENNYLHMGGNNKNQQTQEMLKVTC